MSTARERIYICTLTSRSRRLSRPVHAWDEGEALLVFRELLEHEGVPPRGSLEVVELLGRGGPSLSPAPLPIS